MNISLTNVVPPRLVPSCAACLLALVVLGLVAGRECARAASPAPLAARDGMVVTESPEASRVGVEILAQGGNAVDAAVAVGFALVVTYPRAGNLGGGGFMLIREAGGTAEAIDFREVAPAAAYREIYLGPDGAPDPLLSTETLLGTGVPGTVAGLALAHQRYGKLPWRPLLDPAIRLAEDGFVLDRATARHLAAYAPLLSRHPESARIFLRNGDLYREGEVFRQPELAATLRRLAENGASEFYKGETARLLIAEMVQGGGRITAEDLLSYAAVIRKPLQGRFRDHKILTMPPPSSGGVAVLQMLGMLERIEGDHGSAGSSTSYHLLAEVMRRAFADRAEFLGDPDFSPVPVDGLLADSYIDSLARGVDLDQASARPEPGRPPGAGAFYEATGDSPGSGLEDATGARAGEGAGDGGRLAPGDGEPRSLPTEAKETTHYSIVDRSGNAVAVTYTLNTNYGTGITVTGAGFLLNNELDDFTSAPGSPNHYGLIQGAANAVRPRARPLSSMTPTIVLRGDTLVLVMGSPGGPRIITSVLQSLLNVVEHGMNVQAAVDAPRVHHQWLPDTLYVEPEGIPQDVLEALSRRGHVTGPSDAMGSVQAIQVIDSQGEHLLLGASDPRRNGCPVGLDGDRMVCRCGGCELRRRP